MTYTPPGRVIVSVSGGAGSTLALERCVDRFGPERVLAIFADTNTEDPSLYSAIRHMINRHPSVVFVWITNDGATIWDVFNSAGIIRTPTGACKASLELKHLPIARWMKENADPETDVIASGLEWTEPERRQRFDDRWKPFQCIHPLTWDPVRSNCQIISDVDAAGYPEQALYSNRYPHNNCGGGCVLAGSGQWHGLLMDFPDRYEWHAKRESEFNDLHRSKREPFTVLRDRSGGTLKPMTLADFRERVLNNTATVRDFRSGCGCMTSFQGNLFDQLDEAQT